MSWKHLPPELQTLATAALTQRQLEAWKLEIAGYGIRPTALALGIRPTSVRDRLDAAHLALSKHGVVQAKDGTWTTTEAA